MNVRMADVSVSREHLAIEKHDGKHMAKDLGSSAGSRINGKLFHQQELVYGDTLTIGAIAFRYDGVGLQNLEDSPGASLLADNINKSAGKKRILSDINLHVPAGEFLGILGTSGAGKSTLLDALCGIRPPTSGRILIANEPLRLYLSHRLTACGYVPQDDIVHTELTVRQAVWFSARMRLPHGTPPEVLDQCVAHTLRQLGLEERASVQVHRLSGGQRKRVSIAAEILARPAILFLDEPSSGLDPATEFKLMEQLRELANTGCTVICTTHVMENVYLFDRLLIMTAGRLVFSGPPQSAREHFGIDRFAVLYDRIESQPVEVWQERFNPDPPPAAARQTPAAAKAPKLKKPVHLPLLMQRQWALMNSDWKNLLILLGQPVVIGLLVAWMADSVSFKLFLAYLATFWFGCGNAAQEIVKETAIYRRERMVGMGRHQYLLSKFIFSGVATLVQAIILFLCIHLGSTPMQGSPDWQISGLLATALSAIGIGFALSAWVRSTTQAVMLVPLILLPQIVFSGYVLPSFAIDGAKKMICEIMPSFASQKIMDTSLFWQETLSPALVEEHGIAFKNADPDGIYKMGDHFTLASHASAAMLKHGAWLLGSYFLAWLGLLSKERSR
jgi:ABC transport system ATP-binding/permease protein